MLHAPTVVDLESFFLEKDIYSVGGGNTRSMLAIRRDWGCQRFFEKKETGGFCSVVDCDGEIWGVRLEYYFLED
jgi:peptidase E